MDYELAKKLKEAGYPQHFDELLAGDEIRITMTTRDAAVHFQQRSGVHKTFDLSVVGYPKTEPDYYEQGKWRFSSIFSREYLDSPDAETLYFPTLSELIEACGEKFQALGKVPSGWEATGWQGKYESEASDRMTCGGVTPEEAVARLYLALHPKHTTQT